MRPIRTAAIVVVLLGTVCMVRGDRAAGTPGVKSLATETLPAAVTVDDVANPAYAAWGDISATPIHVNRTPPLYADPKTDDGERPTVTAKAGRLNGGEVVVLIHWTDAAADLAPEPVAHPDVGEESVYPRHTEGVDEFADAVCLMLPRERTPHKSYPSIMMGDGESPVDLYFWRAGVGFSVLKAAGMSTVTETETKASGKATRVADGWTVTMSVGDAPPQTPICFGIWDGGKLHRDGLKYFSIWYEVQ